MLLWNKRFFVILILLNGMLIIFIDFEFMAQKGIYKIKSKLSFLENHQKYYPVYNWMINNNIMQYSSYIIQENVSNKTTIETMLMLKTITSRINNIKFSCLTKNLKTGKITIFESYEKRKIFQDHLKKLIFKINTTLVEDLNDIVIAVVIKDDFIVKENKIIKFDNGSYILPFHMINFQKPKVIITDEKRIKNIAMCVPMTYLKDSISNKEFESWNKNFGIGQLVFFDATSNKMLLNSVDKNDKVVEVRPYCLEYECICTTQYLSFTDENDTSVYLEICKRLFSEFFKDVYGLRDSHVDITANDCYISMSYKYEFTSLYDFDEFVFPRTMNIRDNQTLNYKCEKESKLCSVQSFSINIYEYVQNLVKKHYSGEMDNFASILIPHAAYLEHDSEDVKSLMKDLDELVNKIENNNLGKNQTYPLKLMLPSNSNSYHAFIVEKEDFDYVVNLNRQYKSSLCLFKNIHLTNTSSINKQLLRFLYFVTTEGERLPKSIHYYKNVFSIWVHEWLEKRHRSVVLKISNEPEFILSHFRNDSKAIYNINHESSIRKLGIDYEYLAFLLKNYTSYCKN